MGLPRSRLTSWSRIDSLPIKEAEAADREAVNETVWVFVR